MTALKFGTSASSPPVSLLPDLHSLRDSHNGRIRRLLFTSELMPSTLSIGKRQQVLNILRTVAVYVSCRALEHLLEIRAAKDGVYGA